MKLKILLGVITVFLSVSIFTINTMYKENLISIELDSSLKDLKTNYNIVTYHYESSANSIYKSIINDATVTGLMTSVKTANEKDRTQIRATLLSILANKFDEVKVLGVNTMLVVTPDNKAFLRVHKSNKFDDDLTKIRPAIVEVNRSHQKTIVFESGRVTHAFRNIYPLFDPLGEYIGCIDIGFDSKHLQNTLDTVHKIHSHFLINKDNVDGIVFKKNSFLAQYKQSMENHNYFISMRRDVTHKLKEISQATVKKYQEEIDKNIHGLKEFSIYGIQGNNAVIISFIPIFSYKNLSNPAAYLVSYVSNYQINNIQNNWLYINLVSFILLVVIMSLIYKNLSHKRELELEVAEKTKELKQVNESLEIKVQQRTKELADQTEIAQNATKSKSEFLANMSHEIRTPLNAILGFVDILKKENHGRKSLQYLNIVDESSKSLLKIIEDILDFSKIESGKLDIDKLDFNSKAEFEMITHLFDARCSEKNILLVLNLDPNLPQVVNSDPLRIKQIISNLLSNAVKFTPDGKKITVDITYEDLKINVSVKDEGIGIAKDKLAHIFEAFSQEDSSTTRNYGGTGLGLSISSQLAKLLGGDLSVRSELGKGSEFYFWVPITIGESIALEKEEILEQENILNNTTKVLLVEDNSMNQILMTEILKQMNVSFDIANDGVEAIEMFKENSYDLILMDENMPNMNGIEATKHILDFEKENNLTHTPIIALTANALKGDREKFLAAGMDDYLTKPIDQTKLYNTMQSILEK